MSLMLWDPFLTREFFDRPLRTASAHVSDSENEITLELDAPGMRAEDVAISIDRDTLLVEGKRESERRTRSFSKRYTLPENVDEAGISAKLANGVLSVTLPKREAPSARRIPVLAA